jgi:U3 small nucleolar RNA-associated protein 14
MQISSRKAANEQHKIINDKVQCKVKVKVKGKAVPLQAWTGPEGSRRLRLPDFKTVGT